MKKANFFIIGAPKCGTTALCKYLAERDDVFFSTPKECNYFNTDFSEEYRKKYVHLQRLLTSDEEYTNAFFGGANESHLAVGEGSTRYLISKEAPVRIRNYNPYARIIVMLRNPVSMAPSMHSQEFFMLNENVKTFERAWGLQEERRRGRSLPAGCPDPQLLQYRTACMLGAHMKRLYDVFPREQVLAIMFDRFVKETRAVYNEVLEFLELPADSRTDFPKINQRKVYRSTLLAKLLSHYLLDYYLLKTKRITGIDLREMKAFLSKFNVRDKKTEILNEGLRRELFQAFSSDVDLLENLLGWNLDHWRKLN
jgi:hypothetical protein